MSNQQKRTFHILLAIAAALAAALAAVLIHRNLSAQAETQAEPGALITREQAYSALSYTNGSATLSFILDENGSWVWADDPAFPLDQTTVTAIVDLISSLTPQQTITGDGDLESYGLDTPSATLTASGEDGPPLTLALGKTTTDGQSHYMMMNEDPNTLYIIADTLYDYLSIPIYDMCILPQLPALTEEDLDAITVTGAVTTVLTAVREGEEDGEASSSRALPAAWTDGEGADVTENERLSALLTELETFTLTKCADYRPSGEAASICGFDAPAAAAELASGDTAFTITVGAPTLDGAGYYVRVDGGAPIYQTASDSVDTLLAVAAGGLGA